MCHGELKWLEYDKYLKKHKHRFLEQLSNAVNIPHLVLRKFIFSFFKWAHEHPRDEYENRTKWIHYDITLR